MSAHPGFIVREAIEASGRTQVSWAADLHVSAKHLNQIMHGRANFSAGFAIRFEEVSGGVKAELLMHAQADYLVERARRLMEERG